jgi:hypothetical protein
MNADVFFGRRLAWNPAHDQAIDTANGSGTIAIYDIGQPPICGPEPCVISSVVTERRPAETLLQAVDTHFGNEVNLRHAENGC